MLTSTYRPAVIYCFCKQANGFHSIFGSVNWIYCKLSFALLRALIISVRGARSSRQHAVSEASQEPIDLQLMEVQIH